MAGNENREVCAACGGQCCKRLPGEYAPEDFGLVHVGDDTAKLEEALRSGLACIDKWDGENLYFVRPRTKDRRDELEDYSWGGECRLLTPTGCSLPFEQRPCGCRALEPGQYGINCHTTFGKYESGKAWEPWGDYLFRIAEEGLKDRKVGT